MHSVTQVRTPDELQTIYKELLKLKTMVSDSFGKVTPKPAASETRDLSPGKLDSARKQSSSVQSSGT